MVKPRLDEWIMRDTFIDQIDSTLCGYTVDKDGDILIYNEATATKHYNTVRNTILKENGISMPIYNGDEWDKWTDIIIDRTNNEKLQGWLDFNKGWNPIFLKKVADKIMDRKLLG